MDVLDDIVGTILVWDVDGSPSNLKLTLDAAKIIVDELERHGLSKSVYLKWSARGLHIHVNENAFSRDLLRKSHLVDIAYSTVAFMLRKTLDKLVLWLRMLGFWIFSWGNNKYCGGIQDVIWIKDFFYSFH